MTIYNRRSGYSSNTIDHAYNLGVGYLSSPPLQVRKRGCKTLLGRRHFVRSWNEFRSFSNIFTTTRTFCVEKFAHDVKHGQRRVSKEWGCIVGAWDGRSGGHLFDKKI